MRSGAAWALVVMLLGGSVRPLRAGSDAARPGQARGQTADSPAGDGARRLLLPEPAVQVQFADLDGEGRPDAIVVMGDEGGCRLARARTGEQELRLEPIDLPSPLHAPLLVDIDSDGTVDLLSADEGGILCRRGLGAGRFAPTPVRIAHGADLLLPRTRCEAAVPYAADVNGDGRAELLLPTLGGARVQELPAGTTLPARPDIGTGRITTLFLEPRISGRMDFTSALPSISGAGAARIVTLGPLLGTGSDRLEFAWWSSGSDGILSAHRSAFALPREQAAAAVRSLDLDGDGRPELAALTIPRRLTKLLGEYGLAVYRATDRAEAPVQPLMTTKTGINFWQYSPAGMAVRPPPSAGLMLAFFRGLLSRTLFVEIYSAGGSGSLAPRPREIELGGSRDMTILGWFDVDGDGLPDLAAHDETRLVVYRSGRDPDAPLATRPTWSCRTRSAKQTVVAGIGSSGEFSMRHMGAASSWFRDLDGDGLAELISLESDDKGGSSLVIGRLQSPPPEGRE